MEFSYTAPSHLPERPEKPRASGYRLARAAWRLAKRDPSLAPLALLSAASVALVVTLVVAATSHLSHGFHALSLFFLLLLGAGFAVTFLGAFFGAAMAEAASAGLDGIPISVGDAIVEARQSLGPLAAWAAIGTALLAASELIIWTGPLGLAVGNLGMAVWAFLVIFVVPLITLDAAGAGEAIKESIVIARQRWREELLGGLVIGLVWAVIAFVCLMFYVPGLNAFREHHGAGSAIVMGLGGIAGLLTVLYGIATAQAFAVALLRLDSGDSSLAQLESPPTPLHSGSGTLRLAGLAVGIVAVIALVAALASAGVAERSDQYYTSVPASSAAGLEAGAPVIYDEKEVGDVLSTAPVGSLLRVSFEVDHHISSEAQGAPIQISTFEGSPCLEIGGPPSFGPSPGAT